uniref:Uncharacterized protein n=1 Tax=Zea mays TaxID=4577 RepID=B6T117_MAIZE|nr:hypothetical protein [Zea mays]
MLCPHAMFRFSKLINDGWMLVFVLQACCFFQGKKDLPLLQRCCLE